MTRVVDASVVVAALLDDGPAGRWSESIMAAGPLVAPHLLPFEVANVLRRVTRRGHVEADSAALALGELHDLRIDYAPHAVVADRAWALRENLTAYDASYVALAELLDAPMATLDHALARAPGPMCRFLVPPHVAEDG